MSPPQALHVRGLRKRFGEREVVCGVDLEVAPGECFGLLGPNGAGKTTTLKLCLGLIEPDAGAIELLGEPVPQRAREARRKVGVVPQFDNLNPDFTVAENLLVYGRYFGMSGAHIAARVPELLEFAGLAGRGDSRINTLSGGMKRRLTLARALVNDPQIVFMDEPTTGLDPQARRNFWELVRDIRALGKTVVLTTHYMEEAYALCDELLIMDHGKVIARGAPQRLLSQHYNDVVVDLPKAALNGRSDWPFAFVENGERVEITTADVNATIAALLGAGVSLAELKVRPRTLEDLFIELTGKELRA